MPQCILIMFTLEEIKGNIIDNIHGRCSFPCSLNFWSIHFCYKCTRNSAPQNRDRILFAFNDFLLYAIKTMKWAHVLEESIPTQTWIFIRSLDNQAILDCGNCGCPIPSVHFTLTLTPAATEIVVLHHHPMTLGRKGRPAGRALNYKRSSQLQFPLLLWEHLQDRKFYTEQRRYKQASQSAASGFSDA